MDVLSGPPDKAKKKSRKEKKRTREDKADDVPAVSSNTKKKKKVKHPQEIGQQQEEPSADFPPDELISPVWMETRSYYLPLAPIAQSYPLRGLMAEHLSPMCMTYSHEMKGVMMVYTNPRLEPESTEGEDEEDAVVLAQCHGEGAACWLWVTADFWIYRPEPGMWVEGYVVVHSEGHLGLLLLNVFNASIERKRLPKSWTWKATRPSSHSAGKGNGHAALENGERMGEDGEGGGSAATNGVPEEEGHWEDGKGSRVKRWLKFRVKDWIVSRTGDREKGFFGVEGTLLGDAEEQELHREGMGRWLGL